MDTSPKSELRKEYEYETSREKYGESGNLRESVSGSGTVSVSDK
jgi:hypothetical protein